MDNKKFLNAKLLCYLKPSYAEVHHILVAKGWDSDLALALIETLCGVDTIYDIPIDDKEREIVNGK